MQARDTISVIVPAWNAELYLREALSSIFSQSLPADEVIVVDDGSTDSTRAVAREFTDVKLIAQAKRGAGAARNVGVRAAIGTILAFLDADDVWLPEKLRLQQDCLDAHPDLEAVFAHATEFHGSGAIRTVAAPLPGTLLIRRSGFERIGEYIEEIDAQETADWHLRAVERALRWDMLPIPLCRRRLHGGNRGVLAPDRQGYVRAIKASLDRRRTAGLLP